MNCYRILCTEDDYREMIEDAIDSYNEALGHVSHETALEIAKDSAVAVLNQNIEPINETKH